MCFFSFNAKFLGDKKIYLFFNKFTLQKYFAKTININNKILEKSKKKNSKIYNC